jgi:hypothetical protein
LAAITEREDPADVVILRKDLTYKSIADLPQGKIKPYINHILQEYYYGSFPSVMTLLIIPSNFRSGSGTHLDLIII